MHKFSQFDLKLNIGRLPISYSLGDLSSIREIFTPEDGDIGRTQLPILPPLSDALSQKERALEGYLVELSAPLMTTIRDFLKEIAMQLEWNQQGHYEQRSETARNYVQVRRECMNRLGTRLVEVIKQERRLGVYNLYWLVISKYIVTLLDRVVEAEGEKKTKFKIAMLPVISQALQETILQVEKHFQKFDATKRRYSKYLNDTMAAHLGAAFNHEFARSIIHDQTHFLFPTVSRQNLVECAKALFTEENAKYHITYAEFIEIYSAVRKYIEHRLEDKDHVLMDLIANVLRIPTPMIEFVAKETLMFHPTLISLCAEEIKQLPARTSVKKKTFFKSWAPQLGDMFGEGSWEFAINDYLTFARDLRRSEIITFLRNRVVLVQSHEMATSAAASPTPGNTAHELADKISYQFDKGRIINDLRSVTLIFLDLRGFTELSAGNITDQELKEQLYNFFDPVVNIINYFEGEIKTYAGDGILASFGAHKEHALHAVRAAIEIQKFFAILQREGTMVFHGMGIGIHTGLVEETYFFPDAEAPSHNTVIGLTANLVGRLSSGKTERRHGVDKHAIKELHDYMESDMFEGVTSNSAAALKIFEERLFQAIEALQREKDRAASAPQAGPTLAVRVESGILNNNGIAISAATFTHLHEQQQLQEHQVQGRVHYSLLDPVIKESIFLIKSGDANFKGIEEKFPVWGVYLEHDVTRAEQ